MKRAARPEVLEGLNPEQRRAVLHTDGPLLVLAGAGSGKTRVITCRIAHLLDQGVSPRQILAVTFTNKAAREMRSRVAGLAGPSASDLTVSTFHAFCVRVLRQYAERAGLHPKFAICDDADQLTAVKSVLRDLRVHEATLHPKAALSRISLFKNKLIGPAEAERKAVDAFDELVAMAYKGYDAHLRRSRTVDFDDLLVLTERLLAKDKTVRGKMQDRFRYLLVDEYQDTNGPQYEILRHLAGKRKNLCVVGDDDQSIYGWRGADVRKILDFDKDFRGTTVVRLETNYRSVEPILEAANAVIRNNPARHEKTLRAACGPGEDVRVHELEDEEHEAAFVVDEIFRDLRRGQARPGDFAILFRTQVQPRTFEARLRSARLPYVLVGGMSFFDRKEVRDLLAYLRLADNPDDEASLLRVVNTPARGIGKTTIDKVVTLATKEGISATKAFEKAEIPSEAANGYRTFRAALADAAERVKTEGLVDAVRRLIADVRYEAEIRRCYPDSTARQARWAAVEEVLNIAENYARRTKEATLGGFLEEVTISGDDREEEEEKPKDAITLMTLHAAKGLEFPRVYLVGVEEGLLPHRRSMAEDTVEEERRLMYVGITRARRVLTITRALTRAKYGRREGCVPSRFLFELKGETPPDGLLAPPGKPEGRRKESTRSGRRRR